jgi:hypothetical protein
VIDRGQGIKKNCNSWKVGPSFLENHLKNATRFSAEEELLWLIFFVVFPVVSRKR